MFDKQLNKRSVYVSFESLLPAQSDIVYGFYARSAHSPDILTVSVA